MPKFKTNRQILQKMVREMDDIHLAFVVSQLCSQADKILANKEGVREEMKNSMVHPELWIQHNELLHKFLEQK